MYGSIWLKTGLNFSKFISCLCTYVWAHMKPVANTEQLILSLYCVWFLGMELSVYAWQQIPLLIEEAHWSLDIFDEHKHTWKLVCSYCRQHWMLQALLIVAISISLWFKFDFPCWLVISNTLPSSREQGLCHPSGFQLQDIWGHLPLSFVWHPKLPSLCEGFPGIKNSSEVCTPFLGCAVSSLTVLRMGLKSNVC